MTLYLLHFTEAEKAELLSILPSKLAQRIMMVVGDQLSTKEVLGCYGGYVTPRHPNPAKLMEPSPIGRRVRCASRDRTGIVTSQWVDGDDCSGGFGTLRFDLDNAHPNNNSCSVPATECEFLD